MDKFKIVCLTILVFIVVSDYTSISEAYRFYTTNNIRHTLAFQGESVLIECNISTPLAYCGFLHENNAIYEDVMVQDNKCSVTIIASNTTVGTWFCYLGIKRYKEEIVKKTRLRIVGKLAAMEEEITTIEEQPVTFLCVTRAVTSISYCRFEPPNGKPFRINSNATPNKLLLDRYYYPQEKSFKSGECAVTIIKTTTSDTGKWICAVGLENGQEYKDSTMLTVNGLVADKNGIDVGLLVRVLVLAQCLLVFVWYVRIRLRKSGSRQHVGDVDEIIEMRQMEDEPSSEGHHERDSRVII